MSSINDFETNLSERPLSRELRERNKEAGIVGSQLFMTEASSKCDYVEVILRQKNLDVIQEGGTERVDDLDVSGLDARILENILRFKEQIVDVNFD